MEGICAVHVPTFFSGGPSSTVEEILNGWDAFLDGDALVQIRGYRLLDDAKRCLVGKLLPRYIVSSRFGHAASSMIFRKTPEGRPYLVSSQLPRFDYNISHDADWVVMGWTWSDTDQARIGIDVMKLRNPWSDTTLDDFYQGIQEYLTTHERAKYRDLRDDGEKLRYLLYLWTLKEAYTKALGLGMRFEFRRLQFDLSGVAVAAQVDEEPLDEWTFRLLDLSAGEEADDYVVAIATDQTSSNASFSEALEVVQLSREEISGMLG